MKHLKTAPKETGFFETYVKLAKSIKASGYFAQVVSALTEVGGIFAASLSVLYPIFSEYAVYLAAAVAVIGTAVLEVGLRVVIPQAVDAVLYKRWQGLHLAMSIAVFILGIVLLGTSGVLSYKNSQTVVDTVVEEPELDSAALRSEQINYNAKLGNLAKEYRNDSTATAERYEKRIQAEKQAYSGKLGSAKRELSNWYNRERRTDRSYATQKDRARQKIADLEAEQAAALAQITTERGEALAQIKAEYKAAVKEQKAAHKEAVGEVKTAYSEATTERDNTVSAYGGGLAYFTIICLFIFLVSVILDRIHAKGSGITEKVELSQYDLNPAALVEAWQALRDRIQYNVRSRIEAFAERTPPPPVPTPAPELYDPTELANIAVTLKIEKEQDEDEKVVYIQPKRRAIGFHTRQTEAEAHTKCNKKRHPKKGGNSRAIKGTRKATHETPELRQIKQRLKDYKKRLGKHEQKAKAQERTRGEATRRTLEAIENNKHWVEHYTTLLNQAEAAAKNGKL